MNKFFFYIKSFQFSKLILHLTIMFKINYLCFLCFLNAEYINYIILYFLHHLSAKYHILGLNILFIFVTNMFKIH